MIQAEERLLEKNSYAVIKRLWPWIRDFRPKLLLGGLLILLSTCAEVVMPIIMGWAVDAAISETRNREELYRMCAYFLFCIAGRALLESWQAYVIQRTGQEVTHRMRCLVFRKIGLLPVSYFDRNPTGRLLTRVVNDIKSLSDLFTASISVLLLDAMIILGTTIAMIALHARLGIAVLSTFPLVLIVIHIFGKRLAEAYREVRARLSEINAFLGENISAIATIQRLAAEEPRRRRFERIVESHTAAQMKSLNVFASVQPYANALNGLAMSVLLVLGGYWVIRREISLGVFVAFLGYIRNLYQPVRDLVEKYNVFLSAMVSAERISSIMNEPQEENSEHTKSDEKTRRFSIEFDQVSFRYPLREKNAIDRASFRVEHGKNLAVVGPTGSGKSTLVKLLLRFYEANSGTIRVAEKSVTEWDRSNLRRSIGVVHQEIFLFQGTLRENLVLGRAGIEDSRLTNICERVQLWEFVSKRGGLNMEILEGGTNLSVGEKQLISFARILVSEPPIVILDEATSSIDPELERRLMQGIKEVLKGRTSIVIAHRLATIQECDALIVFNNGKKVEEGTYSDLVKQGGYFAHFHQIYFRIDPPVEESIEPG